VLAVIGAAPPDACLAGSTPQELSNSNTGNNSWIVLRMGLSLDHSIMTGCGATGRRAPALKLRLV
jgi:hypothetical protein